MAVNNFEVLVELHQGDIQAVLRDPGFGAVLLNTVRSTVLVTARSMAPVRKTGQSKGGRNSIQAELDVDADGYWVKVSWDDAHSYMRFQDKGTEYVHGVHFLEAAARQWSV
jgi:hypothetical protein